MEALNREGFELKRSTVYLHLLPWNYRPIEGRRYVTTAPVKIYKSQNSEHASHWSTKFTHVSIRSLEELAAIFGLAFHSQDDNAEVPIGLTAANKQALMLMHIKYQVTLPDHNFVVAPKHKLIPSIIGDMKLVKGKNLVNDAFRCNLFRCFIHRY